MTVDVDAFFVTKIALREKNPQLRDFSKTTKLTISDCDYTKDSNVMQTKTWFGTIIFVVSIFSCLFHSLIHSINHKIAAHFNRFSEFLLLVSWNFIFNYYAKLVSQKGSNEPNKNYNSFLKPLTQCARKKGSGRNSVKLSHKNNNEKTSVFSIVFTTYEYQKCVIWHAEVRN